MKLARTCYAGINRITIGRPVRRRHARP